MVRRAFLSSDEISAVFDALDGTHRPDRTRRIGGLVASLVLLVPLFCLAIYGIAHSLRESNYSLALAMVGVVACPAFLLWPILQVVTGRYTFSREFASYSYPKFRLRWQIARESLSAVELVSARGTELLRLVADHHPTRVVAVTASMRECMVKDGLWPED